MQIIDHKKLQLVVSIALINENDQILISKRPKKKFLSGYWEFPGGKVEKTKFLKMLLLEKLKKN
jgi:8-oxo-dGTP diphosphatase